MSNVSVSRTVDMADELASFTSDLSLSDAPPEARRAAERAIADTTGVTLAGVAEGAGAKILDTVTALPGTGGEASVLGADDRLSVMDAALVNGTAGHGLDFDDVTWGIWHPSVPMVAPLFAAAEHADATGEDVVAGFLAGYETQCYLAAALVPAHYERGWHATATFGTFGATAAVARVLGLDADETRTALNIAASMPSGLKHNFGSMTKPLHAGHAARNGTTAALLAANDFTASEGAIDAKRGFCHLYSGDEEPKFDELPELGDRWSILEEGIDVKRFPCCYFTHTSIAAALDLRSEHDLSPADIESVTVTTSQGAADALHYEDPDTGLEGKFSMEYTVAAALADGEVTLATFDDENVDDPDVQAVRERVTFDVDPDLPYDPFKTTVTVETTAGDSYTRVCEKPPGTADDPLSEAELLEKFEMCADRAPTTVDAEAAFEALLSLRDQPSVDAALDHL